MVIDAAPDAGFEPARRSEGEPPRVDSPRMRFETRAVHAGGEPDETTGAIAPPIHLSTTYVHGPESEPLHGFIYQREGNPTQERVEAALAALDGGEAALAFASGMAAAATLLQALPAGAHVLFHRDVYSGVRNVATRLFPRWGMTAEFVDFGDPAAISRAAESRAAAIWVETPSNPRLDIVDLAAVAAAAKSAGALFFVDGTFATPALQQPLALGADVVMHSTTKYLGGHHDLLGGALTFARRDGLFDTRARSAQAPGRRRLAVQLLAAPARAALARLPDGAALHERARRRRRALDGHPALEAVLYPGLPGHAGHAIAARQMKRFGGMLSLLVRGGRASAPRGRPRASSCSATRPASAARRARSSTALRATAPGSTAPENLLRLSIGLEHPDDLVADLRQALAGAG